VTTSVLCIAASEPRARGAQNGLVLAQSAARKPAPMLAMRGAVSRTRVRPIAFGNALGDSIVANMSSPSAADNRTALNRANQAVDPDYYGSGTASNVPTFAENVARRKAAMSSQTPDWVRDPQGGAALASLKDAQGVVGGEVWNMGMPVPIGLDRVGQGRGASLMASTFRSAALMKTCVIRSAAARLAPSPQGNW
jgi:hypothetical protein